MIWDVGLGAAANAMAAIHCYEREATAGAVRPLRIISFENDLDSLKLALLHNNDFPYLRHAGPPAIVRDGRWQSKQFAGLEWLLLRGDFVEMLRHAPAPPDLIFYDMFSRKTTAEAWTLETFRRLFAACDGRAAELFTYSCSTSVRVALLAAGFFVARGRGMGAKEETTIAVTPAAHRTSSRHHERVLASEWLQRWSRSGAKFPPTVEAADQLEFARRILQHEQFRPNAGPIARPGGG